jgi:Amt family ammonium transporter
MLQPAATVEQAGGVREQTGADHDERQVVRAHGDLAEAEALAVGLKYRFGYDDSLDVVGVHLVAGLWGTIGAGLLATSTGLFYGGGWEQLALQILIGVITLVISLVLTYAIAMGLKATMGWRVTEEDESEGIDQVEHAESAYEIGGFAASSGRTTTHRPAAVSTEQVEGANA